MSFWVVPSRAARGTPLRSAAAMYIAQIGAAGALIVIDVLTRSSGRPVEQQLHVGEAADGDAAGAELALGLRVVGVVAVQRRHVVGDREAGLAGVEELAEPGVRVLGRPEAGEHAHRPRARAVAGGVDAAGERRLAGEAHVPDGVHVRVPAGAVAQRVPVVVDGGRAARAGRLVVGGRVPVPGAVQALDREVAERREARPALREAVERGRDALHPPRAPSSLPVVGTVAHGRDSSIQVPANWPSASSTAASPTSAASSTNTVSG